VHHSEYIRHDGLGLAALIRAGEVSAAEVDAAARAAIAALNPGLNAVLSTLSDQPSAPGQPFSGVPFLIKELVLTARGAPCRSGSRALADAPQGADTELMARFRQAGLHLVGTTQSPEMGYNATTEPVAFGPVHNPWKRGHSAGGSSGGSGAAVAAGVVPIAHANDGGGSIRIPASCNGLVGLKPTRDRTPTGPGASDPLFAHAIEFVVTRSIRDCAALLDAVAGPDLGAPHLIAPPTVPFAAAAAAPHARLRIAVVERSLLGQPVAAECSAAIAHAGAVLEGLGHELVPCTLALDFDEFARHINVIWCASAARFVDEVSRATACAADADHFEAVTLTCAEFGAAATSLDVLAALDYVNRISRETARAFEGFDVLMSSTTCAPPPLHGTLDQHDVSLSAMDWTRNTFRYAGNTPLFNSTGQPAISLPLYWTADQLPVGVQFAGPMGGEGLLLNLGAQLELATGWAERQAELRDRLTATARLN
jgi:amidase